MSPRSRKAKVQDVHELAQAMPYVEIADGTTPERPVYQVGRKSFVFFRTPRPDAFDPETGERYDDVIVFWVDPIEKVAIVLDESNPFFTTPLRRAGGRLARRASATLTLVYSRWLAH